MNHQAALSKEAKPFQASGQEFLCACFMLPLTFLYVTMSYSDPDLSHYLFGVFTLAFIFLGEYFFRHVKRSPESLIFMIMTLITGTSLTFSLGHIWDGVFVGLLTHLFAVYWILCRSGKLYYQKTSHLFILDGLNGFIFTPFGNYPLIIQTLVWQLKKKDKPQDRDGSQLLAMAIASILGIGLLCIAIRLLIQADGNYQSIMKLPDFSSFRIDSILVTKLILTAIIAPYLYGLFGGCYRTERETLDHNAQKAEKNLLALKKVPGKLWILFIALFTIFYLLFFLLQGSYMFDALKMVLPENYTFSSYARKGFGEMIGITFLNFVLLWLATRTSLTETKVKAGSILLTLETTVFILIASLKLFMYIQAYGWTPLRAQSIWLSGVLFFTCGCILYRLIRGKDMARIWFICSACSLGILTLF